MTVAEALREAAARLGEASDTARLDAEVLMAHALGVERSELLLRHLGSETPPAYAALVERRLGHEPVAYIVGHQEFYGLELLVTPAVLIPRGDSELLIEAARGYFEAEGRSPAQILDLGTGSGALLLAALSVWPEAEGRGIDRSPEAIFVALKNAQRHANTFIGVIGEGAFEVPEPRPDRGFAKFTIADWTQPGWAADPGRFDLILANPPYVEDEAALAPSVRAHEPPGALFAGPEGLEAYRSLVPQLAELLATGGIALVEIGAGQAEAVGAIAENAGFSVRLHHDLAGRPRALALRPN